MALLKDIAPSVQQVAEAIAIAVGVEVEIVDNQLTVIGGTSIYENRIGQKEEGGRVDGDYLYARVMRSGVTECIEDAINYKYYDSMIPEGEQRELAEICTPIKLNKQVLGVIGMVAIDKKQKALLLDKRESMMDFAEKMADLLAAKAAQQESHQSTETVLETTHEGIIAIDNKGYIVHCNSMAETLFNKAKSEILGSHISKFMFRSPALEVLRTGVGYTENEEIYINDHEKQHFIVTTKPIIKAGEVSGAVISFRDIVEAQRLVYNINIRAYKYTFSDIIGNSAAIKRAISQAQLTARGNSTVLITGESGTGKEMFAKSIHYASPRAKGPFVTVNCGAIPENLLESELFGYEKGAFTGASDKGKIGKFEQAHGGTIFLDEIGDMPPHLQVKILHVLQNMRFEKVGGNKTVLVDVRVIAATNKNLEEMIKEGTFREDLYYRLSVIPLSIPALRERNEDIVTLMYHFLAKYNVLMNKKITGFSPEVEELYKHYHWPGNVRELENAVEYGVNMAFSQQIDMDAVPARLLNADTEVSFINESLTLAEQLKVLERKIISNKLKKHEGCGGKDKAAEELGLSRATLYRKLSELDIN